jgi:GR25 family glycosyltransferase involved in LPS biosynthesis
MSNKERDFCGRGRSLAKLSMVAIFGMSVVVLVLRLCVFESEVEFMWDGQLGKDTGDVQNAPRRLLEVTTANVGVSTTLPVFYINLERSDQRRKFMEEQLMHMQHGQPKFKRIRANNQNDAMRATNLVKTLIPPNYHELGCLTSHLLAIWNAVHDTKLDPENPFAIIMEDDVEIQLDVNFMELVKSAPPNFGILQVTTSNSVEVGQMWEEYIVKANESVGPLTDVALTAALWRPHGVFAGLWSTQAYIIQKSVVRGFIDRVVKLNSKNVPMITIIHPNKSNAQFCAIGRDVNCYLPFRLVADMYLYAAMTPVYSLKVPIFNGAVVGTNTTIPTSPAKDAGARQNFIDIGYVLNSVRGNHTRLPRFIRPIGSDSPIETSSNLRGVDEISVQEIYEISVAERRRRRIRTHTTRENAV